jgi:hypothetical protein
VTGRHDASPRQRFSSHEKIFDCCRFCGGGIHTDARARAGEHGQPECQAALRLQGETGQGQGGLHRQVEKEPRPREGERAPRLPDRARRQRLQDRQLHRLIQFRLEAEAPAVIPPAFFLSLSFRGTPKA